LELDSKQGMRANYSDFLNIDVIENHETANLLKRIVGLSQL